MRAPSLDHKEVSETKLCYEAGAQAKDQDTEGESQESASVRKQD